MSEKLDIPAIRKRIENAKARGTEDTLYANTETVLAMLVELERREELQNELIDAGTELGFENAKLKAELADTHKENQMRHARIIELKARIVELESPRCPRCGKSLTKVAIGSTCRTVGCDLNRAESDEGCRDCRNGRLIDGSPCWRCR